MNKIEIKNRWTNEIIFDHESENNTTKTTLYEAISSGISLQDADLCGVDLCGINLRGADLRNANLRGTDLRGTSFYGTNLCGASLRGASFYNDDFCGADLSNSYKEIIIDRIAVFSGIYKYVAISIIDKNGQKWVKLGCFMRTLEDWEKDFWNNNSEFLDDNSLKSNLRVLAYETCKKWLELNEI